MMIDLIGLAAGFAVIATFYCVVARRVRVLAILSNFLFLGYAFGAELWPVILLHGLLLPLNLMRLWELGPPREKAAPRATSPRFAPPRPEGAVWSARPQIADIYPAPSRL